jgi:hypothetical protein
MARTTLTALESDARDELRDRWTNYREDFAVGCESDVIHEVADAMVPAHEHDRGAEPDPLRPAELPIRSIPPTGDEE